MTSALFIPELGHLAMIWRCAWRWFRPWCRCSAPGAATAVDEPGPAGRLGQFAFLLFAFGCLTYAFMTDDFSVAYVASNSNSALPWYYKFSAVWGAHEGSLLLWALILGGWTFAVSVFSRQLPQVMLARVLAWA
jgi:cytochrome c-type biogenesis protein CcmF